MSAIVARLRSARAILLSVLGAALVWSYYSYARLPLTRPTAGDYAQATAYIRAHVQPQDLIDVVPFWAGRARQYLGDLPMAAFRHLEQEDLSRYGGLWLFSLFGEQHRHDRLPFLLVDEQQFGRINVRRYQLPAPAAIAYDFRARLGDARVFVGSEGGERPCGDFRAGRWLCGEAWNYVGREILEMGDEPRAVIYAHPVEEGVLTVEYAAVPLARQLIIRAGLTPLAVRSGGAPVTLAVEIDGREVWQKEYPSVLGFARSAIDTSALTRDAHNVRFKVTTTRAQSRYFVFAAEARG